MRDVFKKPYRSAGTKKAAAKRASLRGAAKAALRYQAKGLRSNALSSRRIVVPTAQGGATSASRCVVLHKKKKMTTASLMRRIGAPNFYVRQLGQQFVAQQGFQNANAFSWNSLQDLNTMLNTVPDNIAAPLQNLFKTNRYELSSMTGEMLLTNSSLATAYVEIYDIVCKKNDSGNFGSVPNNPLALNDPVNAWFQGVADLTQTPTNPFPNWQIIKSLPYDSQLFNTYFKVVKRHHIGMPQGSTHRHTVNLDVGKILDGEYIQSMGQQNQQSATSAAATLQRNLAGITMWSMVVAYGQPASTPITEPTPQATVVTTARVAIDVVQSLRYKYTWIQDTTRSGLFTDNLSSLPGEQVVSIGAGQIVPNNIV